MGRWACDMLALSGGVEATASRRWAWLRHASWRAENITLALSHAVSVSTVK
jgi:hypothetical protein